MEQNMQQDKDLKNRIEPPQMDHLAEQIIARSKAMPQERETKKVLSFPSFFKKPQLSYALAAACCVLLVATVVNRDVAIEPKFEASEVAETSSDEWDEFLLNEEEVMFAGL